LSPSVLRPLHRLVVCMPSTCQPSERIDRERVSRGDLGIAGEWQTLQRLATVGGVLKPPLDAHAVLGSDDATESIESATGVRTATFDRYRCPVVGGIGLNGIS